MTILCNGSRIGVPIRSAGVIGRGILAVSMVLSLVWWHGNNVAVRWIDGVVYVVSRNVRRDGSLGRRYAVVTAEQWLDMHRVPGDESCVAWLESYCKRMR